ncbi:heavy metal translocating P-type ATPase [Salinicoccus luteus]|uniref:heavy metal translocating P-type ATPase n=1 Tax=Salinicoccus luteus TaxID=367840 RepID=UPI0006904C79|nr:heavy metal translocating P-type ATPase [Salinicoccus luteus]
MRRLQLYFTVISGLLIAVGFYMERFTGIPWYPLVFMLAFLIGGWFQAREGVTTTVEEKKLNVELLMIIAAIGASIIGYWFEGAILIFIFSLSGTLEAYAGGRTRDAVQALIKMKPNVARRERPDGEYEVVDVEELDIGDIIMVRRGDVFPIDGVITEGGTEVNEASLTGESALVIKNSGDTVLTGSINEGGVVLVRMTVDNEETIFNRMVEMVRESESVPSKRAQFIDRFENKYVWIVLITTGFMMFLPHYIFGWSWNETFYRAMVLLVVASPCAVVASITPATLSAISTSAKSGVLVKGGKFMEQLADVDYVLFDKTGTLTKGEPVITHFEVAEGEDRDRIAASVYALERESNHPLAVRISDHFEDSKQEGFEAENVHDVVGRGVEAHVDGHTVQVFKAEADDFMEPFKSELLDTGHTVTIYIEDGVKKALIALKDIERPEAADVIERLNRMGKETVMVSGDNPKAAESIAKSIGLKKAIGNQSPEDKVRHINAYKEKGIVMMVGDGVNDAPGIKQADIGVAMGKGTGIALETADIVLMKEQLSRLPEMMSLSARLDGVIKQNLIFSVAVILLLITSNFFQAINLPLGVIGHEGSTILVILNGLRLLVNREFNMPHSSFHLQERTDDHRSIGMQKYKG